MQTLIILKSVGDIQCSLLLSTHGLPEGTTEPLPSVNINALLDMTYTKYEADPDVLTISVEVMAIVGTTATSVPQSSIFYDSEVLAIIHRMKTKSSGLVSTMVWSWRGKRAKFGDKEDRKLQELARRYNTTPVSPPIC